MEERSCLGCGCGCFSMLMILVVLFLLLICGLLVWAIVAPENMFSQHQFGSLLLSGLKTIA